MNWLRRAGSERDEGFTLIELLLVIVILGVLAAVVVMSVRGVVDRGGTSACEASRATVRVSVEAFYARHAKYPANLNELGAELLDDVDRAVVAGPPPYTNTLEGGPGRWAFHYTYASWNDFHLSSCVMLT